MLPLPVAAPMSGAVVVLGAVALLTVETNQMHHWSSSPGGVASTRSPAVATGGPVCLPRPPGCDPLNVEPTGMSSGSDFDNVLDYRVRKD